MHTDNDLGPGDLGDFNDLWEALVAQVRAGETIDLDAEIEITVAENVQCWADNNEPVSEEAAFRVIYESAQDYFEDYSEPESDEDAYSCIEFDPAMHYLAAQLSW
jgi:hypothetical protein